MGSQARDDGGPGREWEVLNGDVFSYDSAVTVELRGRDARGEPAVVSDEFEPLDAGRTVSPRGELDLDHATEVRELLAEEGYELTE